MTSMNKTEQTNIRPLGKSGATGAAAAPPPPPPPLQAAEVHYFVDQLFKHDLIKNIDRQV